MNKAVVNEIKLQTSYQKSNFTLHVINKLKNGFSSTQTGSGTIEGKV
jgi:hypothetical protein